uniref:dolichyl-P-Man:Man5GlcNAc2-PP-dolichol alpha-1,3-mannosyltransferase n=1 Tax=Steinernema glaseri TaxID=37863 RepID=A0A1I7Y3U4_9BILA
MSSGRLLRHDGCFQMGFNLFQSCIRALFTVNSFGFFVVASLLTVAEIFVTLGVIRYVPYTEIDWSTYMQQVECYMNGTRNYTLISGDTGPIVYPAGHLFIYRFLYSLTDAGTNIRRAQYIFGALYILTILLVFRIYAKTRSIPPFVLILLCCTSYRIHSIFMLRLFNDPVAMFLLYLAVNLFISQQWFLGCVLYSLAVSVKMNILLFAPALFFILLFSNGIFLTTFYLAICAAVQVLVAGPFLVYDPVSYLMRSFELGRVFMYKWTVNWRLLPESVFLDKRVHIALLAFHIVVLIIFSTKMWFRSQGGLVPLLKNFAYGPRTRIGLQDALYALFTSNLIGIAFARSLHYQFYSWYFHSLPFILFINMYRMEDAYGKKDGEGLTVIPWKGIAIRVAILLGIEYCWNTYPSTVLSSTLLHIFHASIFVILVLTREQSPVPHSRKGKKAL